MLASDKKIHALVIDDDSQVLSMSLEVLNRAGVRHVDTVSDGSFALGVLENASPPVDLVICDLNMPEMDGIEFMRHAHDMAFNGSLIFLSHESRRILETASDLAKAYNLNVLGALQKPLKPEQLEQLLHKFRKQDDPRNMPVMQTISVDELRSGITSTDDQQLMLYYQPKVCVSTGKIHSVEALARWQHPERGLLGPGAFIPVAEKEGLIDVLTFAIYRKAIQQIAEWNAAGLELKASVNFSVNTFSRENFLRFLLDTASDYDISLNQIMLEVTETQIMENATDCLEVLMRLRLRNFGLSIDDFGTGNSSLVQLKNIPFSELKIDRAFVNGARQNSSAQAILETSVELARKLDMHIVAEGVETREDWDLVEKLGIDYVQGFYCAKPMANSELLEFISNWQGPH